ncbi:uncharacterized protein LOC135096773 isoform X3 [Scylla paramamosain]|uniref:uncharacterized protein LOC135096773 isoform X3 n=1 Tax=Scylla paramamosain TaxID=85552 RepID=UPI003083B298
MEEDTKPSNAKPTVSTVTVKLSPFCASEAASWFRRAEVQFRLRKVTSPQTKADYVLEAIPETIFPRITAWLDNQDKDVIDDLKQYLLQRVHDLRQRLAPTSSKSSSNTSGRHHSTCSME